MADDVQKNAEGLASRFSGGRKRAEPSLSARGFEGREKLQEEIERNPLVNGVLVEVEPTEDGPIEVNHGLGRVPVGCIVAGSDIGVFAASISGGSKKSSTVSISPQWELLERVDIEKTTDFFDFSAEVYGDRDHEFQVHGYWIPGQTATASLRYRINGVISSSLAGDGYSYNGQTAGTGTAAGVALARSNGSEAQYIMLWSTLHAKSGQHRMAYGYSSHTSGTTAAGTENITYASKLHDTTTKFTSLGVQSAQVNDIDTGSWFTLSRRPRLTGRKLKLWIF